MSVREHSPTKIAFLIRFKENLILVLQISSLAFWKANNIISPIHLNFGRDIVRDNIGIEMGKK